jgi:hypothetical protein
MRPADLTALADQTKHVAEIRGRLAKIKSELASVRDLFGQHGYSVTVAGVRVEVADMDSRTYMAKLIRGREMIHLGAIKALDAMVDAHTSYLASAEAKLAKIATGSQP